MSLLSMMEAELPPGFRFHPRDDELVCDYLAKKISHGHGDGTAMISSCRFLGERCPMIDVDLNKCEPWDLPELACVGGKEWYLFSLRDRKYASGQRTNRATASGYWKATGKDRHITRRGLLVGMRKTLVFYQGRAPKGSKTDWVMHEFRCIAHHISTKQLQQQDWVLCRIFYKSTRVMMSTSKPRPSCSMGHEDACSKYSSSSSDQLPAVPPLYSMSLQSTEKYISFGTDHQPPPILSFFQGYQYHEQVPCFSTTTATAATTTMMAAPASVQTRVVERSMPCSTKISQFAHGLPPDLGMNLHLDCDKKVIRAVLDHLTAGNLKREQPPPLPTSLGQGNMDTFYLCHNY